jgi:hypothetical protein
MSDEIECAPPGPAALSEPSPDEPSIEQVIELWWQDHFPGSAVARDTEAWNVAFAAKEALKRRLAQAQHAVLKGSM